VTPVNPTSGFPRKVMPRTAIAHHQQPEWRPILDPLFQYVFPSTISFVATEAQFTPKSVETPEEREKLMFRVKLQADPAVLDKYHRQVKTGVRGLGFVRTDPKIVWPAELTVKLPQ